MARWEAFCLLLAVRAWQQVVFASSGQRIAMGDALGMLYGAVRFKSKDPGINLIFMELALVFAPRGATIEAMHLWSEENTTADARSRLDDDAVLPTMLTTTTRTTCCLRQFRVLGHTPTPPRRPGAKARRHAVSNEACAGERA